MTSCPRCGIENTPDSNFCRRCGERLTSGESNETTGSFTAVHDEKTEHLPIDYAGIAGTVLQIRSDGDREGEIIGVEGEVMTIGRSPDSDLFLDDVTVSRHHARVVVEPDAYFIEDLNSLNGTYVNRKRIERHQLFDGDELQIGKYKLAFLQQKTDA